MCRIFGFKSILQSKVHSSLIQADNAIATQSLKHPDGWGVSYYLMDTPHVIKSSKSAIDDSLFSKVSGVVSSQTVLAHIRKATQGGISSLNAHPFQYGKWTFAHNGNIKDFLSHKDQVIAEIKPEYSQFILGETDSEILFFYLMSKLSDVVDLSSPACSTHNLLKHVESILIELQLTIGANSKDALDFSQTFTTFILTNGNHLIAYQGGQPLYFCTYKKRCSERETCDEFKEYCENPSQDGRVNHLVLSSEPVEGENVWTALEFGQIIGISNKMIYSLIQTKTNFD